MPFHNPKQTSLLDIGHLAGTYPTKLYIVYSDSDHHRWWMRFLKNGYKHAYAVKFTGFFWLKMELTTGFMDFDVLPYDQYDTIKTILKGQDVTYQYIEQWRKPRYRVRTIFAPWTCIEAMKALLGLRAWWVLTPYQLFKHLRGRK